MRAIAVLVLAGTLAAFAQSPQAPSGAAFEVASVKPNTSGSTSSSSNFNDRALTATNVTFRMLIANAYGVRPNRIEGPGWLDDNRFDITARAPENAPRDQGGAMLQALLAERFKLVAHTETRGGPIYALVLARSDGRLGPKLIPSTDCARGVQLSGAGAGLAAPRPGELAPCGTRSSGNATGTTIIGGARTMADLARTLDGTEGRGVVDRTGLTGTFNFELRFARPGLQVAAGGPDADLPSLFTALQEQLGLKLESARGPVEFLIVDRVEQPTPD